MKQQIRSVNNLAEFNQLEESWNLLMTSSSLPFHTFEWHQSLLENYPETQDELLVFVLEENDQVTAIMPCREYNRGKSLTMFSHTTGIQADIVTKDRQAASCLLKHALRYAQDRGISARFDGIDADSYLFTSFIAHSRNGENPLLHQPASNQLKLSLEDYKAVEPPNDPQQHQFAVMTGRKISRNLLLEIEQYHNVAKTRSDNYFKSEDFVPFLNRLRYHDAVGLTIHILRDSNRDIVAVDLGFRRGRNYYSLFYLSNIKRKSRTENSPLLDHLALHLKTKGVRNILSANNNNLLKSNPKTGTLETQNCIAYGSSKIDQCQFMLQKQKQNKSKQLGQSMNLLKIRARLLKDASQTKLHQSQTSLQESFKESSSRLKARRSSST